MLWPQKDFLPLSLKEGPVYVQVCLLGQLSQTELFPPVFPQLVNNTLAFDRVIMIINWTHDLLLFLGVQSPFVAARSLEKFEKLYFYVKLILASSPLIEYKYQYKCCKKCCPSVPTFERTINNKVDQYSSQTNDLLLTIIC